jgi:ubiquinone/menaquinone biosynthesis C-methylase UbiE
MSTAKNTYVMGNESAPEMARLLKQDLLVTHCMGGLFPELVAAELAGITSVLDIASGPGGWVLEVAREHPHMHVTGIDISQTMIEYATALARSRGLETVQFASMDATEPLKFPDSAFDFVNARLLSGFMGKDDWPRLLQECVRIVRPGGIVRLTEWEGSITTSPAQEKLCEMLTNAGFQLHRTFSPDGRHICITPMLTRFLRNVGCVNVHSRAFVIDFSSDSEAHEGYGSDVIMGYEILRPLLTQLGHMSDKDYSLLYEQFVNELLSDNFCGLAYHLTAWGRKPHREGQRNG